jgi:hypothetical protein
MKRQTVIFSALAATLAATAYLALQPDTEAPAIVSLPAGVRTRAPVRAAITSVAPDAGVAAAADPRPLRVVRAGDLGWTQLTPAALAAWAPPAPPPPPPAPAVIASEATKPRPPAFPYRWIGLLVQDGRTTALLDGPQRSLGVQAGQVLEQRWRVERIGAERIDLIWLPTGDAVTLDKR